LSPFDSARYSRLLKGLEVSVVPFSAVNLGDRVDAEFFSKENLAIEDALRDHQATPLRELCTLTASAFYPAATDLYVDGDIPFARCVDCVEHPVVTLQQDADFVRIPKWFVEDSAQISCVTRGDIIITKVGSPCFASLVHDYDRIALSRTVLGLVKIRGVNPYYLTAFLRCRFGFSQLLRQREQTIQYQLTLDRVRDVLVYRASQELQGAIEVAMLQYIAALEEASRETEHAETTLTTAIGLSNWQPPEPLTYIRLASEVSAAGRMDPQYFTPRVAELLAHFAKGGRTLGDVAPPRQERFAAVGTGTFRYVEIGDVRSDGTAMSETLPIAEAPSRATFYARSGDVLTSTVRPNRRLSAIVAPEQDGCVVSSGFVVLIPQAVPSEVLLTYLRLPLFCELMDLHTSASLYPAISDRDLLALPFPAIPAKATSTIVAAVQAIHAARQRAHALLNNAKRAVEIAIEDSETAALNYLKSQGA
jgi:hypothetical protein